MLECVVDLVKVIRQLFVELNQGPDGVRVRIHFSGEFTNIRAQLGIARKEVKKLGVGGAKKPLHLAPEPGFSGRATNNFDLVKGASRFHVDRLELFAAVDHD